jgi:hypothetical protein
MGIDVLTNRYNNERTGANLNGDGPQSVQCQRQRLRKDIRARH